MQPLVAWRVRHDLGVIGLHQDVGCGLRAEVANDLLVGAMVAIDVEDDQVRIEGGNILLGGAHQGPGQRIRRAPGSG